MEVSENQIRDIVAQVVRNLDMAAPAPSATGSAAATPSAAGAPAGVHADIEGAVTAAREAQDKLIRDTLELRREMIRSMRSVVSAELERISRLAVEETGMGRWQDKVLKNQLAALKTPGVEDLQPSCYSDDHGLTLTEWAPYGVIGAIAPSTNPTETIINNAIGMIAGGNTVVFNAHPAAKRVSALTVALLNEAIMKAGGPPDCVTTCAEPTIETAQRLMNHPDIALLVVTGGPAVVREALKSSKKVIAAGPGNPPCVVDETADLVKAGRDIVRGAGLDNNIICICEKEILAVASIADRLKAEMVKNGAFELNRAQTEAITRLVIQEPGGPGREGAANKRFVGRNAHLIAAEIGLVVPERTRLLLCEVERDHPLVWTEQLMPVIPLVRLADVDEAIDFAKQCEHGFRHTAVMHSLNIEKLSRMAKVMNCSLFVKNGSAYNGMAQGGAGYTSFTIASPTGEGFTRARTFTRQRRCALIDYFRIV
jgi:acyl-CoA reductase-like NAD-dependent aldehyde dehydrogenase